MHENKAMIQVAAALAVSHLHANATICFELSFAPAPYQPTADSARAMRRELHPLGFHFTAAEPSPKRTRKTAAQRRLEAVSATAKTLGIYRGR